MSKANKFQKFILLVLSASSSSAMATTYVFSRHGQREEPVCQAFKKLLSNGLVTDAKEPLCFRRFSLDKRASKYGFNAIEIKGVQPSRYRALLKKMMVVAGGQPRPLTNAEQKKDEIAVDNLLKKYNIKIYRARFDNDNGGRAHVVYLEDVRWCPDKNVDRNIGANPTIFMAKPDGTLNKHWGFHDETSGNPVIYRGRTYYVRWNSLVGSVLKNGQSQLEIFDYEPPVRGSPVPAHVVFPRSRCTIYQINGALH